MDDLGFADDRRIETHDQDLLGRSAFAKNLAAAIVGWKNKESLVIALMGAWGSDLPCGKRMCGCEATMNRPRGLLRVALAWRTPACLGTIDQL